MTSYAIVPAAGRSERMGQAKLLLPWGERTVIDAVLAAWRESGVDHVIVTVHPDDDELADVCRAAGAEVAVAAKPPPDMKASVRVGLDLVRALYQPGEADVWLLAPADLPRLNAQVIDQLLAAGNAGAAEILVPAFEGRRGHPTLFPWPLAAEVAKLEADAGINRLLDSQTVREVAVDSASVLEDIDTQEDYEQLRGAGTEDQEE